MDKVGFSFAWDYDGTEVYYQAAPNDKIVWLGLIWTDNIVYHSESDSFEIVWQCGSFTGSLEQILEYLYTSSKFQIGVNHASTEG